MESTTEDEKIWKFKSKTLIIGLIALLSFTTPLIISGALIYFEFRALQVEITTLKDLHIKDNLNTNNRIDKKTERNAKSIEQIKSDKK